MTVLISTVFGIPIEFDVQVGLLAFVLKSVLMSVDFPSPDDPERKLLFVNHILCIFLYDFIIDCITIVKYFNMKYKIF